MRRLLASLGMVVSLHAAVSPAQFEQIDRYVRAEMKLNQIPGLALALVWCGRVELHAWGVRSLFTRTPMDVDTPVDLASVSKPLTAVAVARLARAGKLHLDRPVAGWLVELQGTPVGELPLREFLRHRSGLRRRHDRLVPCCGRPGDGDLSAAARNLGRARPVWAGRIFGYANANYVLLAAVIERASMQPFAQFMEREVFRRLGMTKTTLDEQRARAWGLAASHERCWGRVRPRTVPQTGWPGASLVKSTARDMAVFLQAALEGRVEGIERPQDLAPPYDAGWFVGRENGLLVLEHSGDTWGANAAVLLVPAEQLGVAVLINAGIQRALPIARGLARLLLYGAPPAPARPAWYQVADNWAMLFTALSPAALAAAALVWMRLCRQVGRGERGWRLPSGAWERGRMLLLVVMAAYVLVLSARAAIGPAPGSPPSLRLSVVTLGLAGAAVLATVAALGLAPRTPQD
ncbi:MAG: serine hydrolase domain-containing protein [Bryobacteraceae bacterium]